MKTPSIPGPRGRKPASPPQTLGVNGTVRALRSEATRQGVQPPGMQPTPFKGADKIKLAAFGKPK